MISRPNAEIANVRVWVVAAEAWHPDSLFDEPQRSTVLFPATERCLTEPEAEQFVAGFNEQMLPLAGRRWSIARRVTLGGDLTTGQRLGDSHADEDKSIARASTASASTPPLRPSAKLS
ncbi:MAG: hypothetical protein WD875_12015 [Pirellulales bacterium]